jgi:1,4-alpha-glucan branching enzyme
VSSPPTPALKAAKPQTSAVKFTLTKPDAKVVSVCGEFNEWSVGTTPMKQRRDGQWETVLELKPGRYQYKFVVDGEWLSDPAARENVPNPHGSLNSVIAVS